MKWNKIIKDLINRLYLCKMKSINEGKSISYILYVFNFYKDSIKFFYYIILMNLTRCTTLSVCAIVMFIRFFPFL